MIRIVCALLLMGVIGAQLGDAQTLTKEKRKSVEKKDGDTTTTESVIISQSEDITPRSQMILINPLKFLLFYNLSYFHKVSSSVAVGAGVQFPTIQDLNGYGLNAEVRIYPSGKSPRGFYVAPNISYNKLWSGDNQTEPFSVGALVGWQWFPGEDFAIGLGIGADHYSGTLTEGDDNFGKYEGWVPALRFDIGYAW